MRRLLRTTHRPPLLISFDRITRYELVKDDISVLSFCLVIPVSGKPKVASCDFGTTQYDSSASTVR